MYFYLEDDKLSFYDIYVDNIERESNKMKTISDVCTLPKYKIYDGCKGLDSGDQIDEEVNNKVAGFKEIHEGIISSDNSKVPIYVEPTNEELMIIRDTYEICKK